MAKLRSDGRLSISQRVPAEVHAALRVAAQREARTIGLQTEYILRQWLIAQGYLDAPEPQVRPVDGQMRVAGGAG